MRKLILVILVAVAGFITLYFVNYFMSLKTAKPSNNNSTSASVEDNLPKSSLHTEPTYGYKIRIPKGYKVESMSANSIQILPDVEVSGVGPTNFIYVSFVPADRRNESGEVYNYNPEQFAKLVSVAEVGNSTNFATGDIDELANWFEYTLVSIENFGGARVKNFQNSQPWEFPSGTTENRFIYDTGDKLYILGYYTGGEGVDPKGLIDPRTAHAVVKSFTLP